MRNQRFQPHLYETSGKMRNGLGLAPPQRTESHYGRLKNMLFLNDDFFFTTVFLRIF